jgi:nicotinate-nucleotide adenylyltransferase
VTDSASASVGIFGGSFNPPHLAHLIVAEIVREQFRLDAVLWIPACQSPFKTSEELAPATDRLEMTRLAVCENDGFAVSEIELERSGVSYTVDTIRSLQELDPGVDYHLIMGADGLRDFSNWREPEEILRRVSLIVYRRSGIETATLPAGLDGRVAYADAPRVDLSSSAIRERLRAGRSIRYMVPEAVHRYVLDRGLYGRSS